MCVLNVRGNQHYSQYNCKTLDRSQVTLLKPWNISLALNARNIPRACLHSHLYMVLLSHFCLLFLSLIFQQITQNASATFFPNNISLCWRYG